MNPGDISPAIEQALRRVPRAAFVGPQWRARAGEDRPLPIDCGQTTSQPSLVAYMTEQLGVNPRSRVLEIGTGSGFQTAILAEVVAEVFTIEWLPELAASARQRLEGLGYRNISYRVGDGTAGWPEAAPFDAIIVTAAGRVLPPALIAQLRSGGRLLAPLGEPEGEQTLVLVETRPNGEWRRRDLCSVWFVPLVSASLGDLHPPLGEPN
jgi:protein-L-isoaspartate(D-aspartate) O-methyltransferase